MKEIISRDKKVRLYNVNLDLSNDKIKIIRRELIFASENLQRSDLIFRAKALIRSLFKRLKNLR